MTPEDKRQAVNMAAGLSGQLITAALGMIALQGAYVAFAADKKQCGFWFWALMLAAFLIFVASIFCAGKGTAKLYKDGFAGKWNPDSGKGLFNAQAGLCLAGILLFIAAVSVARHDKLSSAEPTQNRFDSNVQTQLEELKKQVGQLQQQILELKPRVGLGPVSRPRQVSTPSPAWPN